MTNGNSGGPIRPRQPWINTQIVRSIAPTRDPLPAPPQPTATTDCTGSAETSPNRQLVVDPAEPPQSITTVNSRNEPEGI